MRRLLLIALLAPPATPTHSAGSDWPGFLGPAGDGTSPETGIIKPWPAEGLKILWQTDLGEGYAPPTVADGRLFHFDRYGDAARLTCRDARTGERLWQFEYPTDYEDLYGYDGGPRCCPVVDGDRVYVHGVEGMLHCLGAADGELRWKFDTLARYRFHQNFFGVGSTPVVEGELLLVAVGGSPEGPRPFDLRDAKPDGSAVVAFDKRTGEVKYAAGDELASYASPRVVTIGGERVGLHFARGGLLAFDAKTGAKRGHFPWRARILESVNAANPVVVGDRVFVSECYGLGSALLRVTGDGLEPVWADEAGSREKSMECHWNTPIHKDGYVYGCSGRHTNGAELRCVDWKTGDVVWTEPRHPRRCRTSLTYADGHFFSMSEYGDLSLIEATPEKYVEVSRWEVPGLRYPCWAAPVLSHGLLYVRGQGRLICLEAIPSGK